GINAVSAITFLFAGALDWHVAIILIAGALIGGYSGATLSKKLKPSTLRAFIVLYGTAMTLYFFLK
ncbi:MAG: permease, partial [Alphaproteobacteria bacterium]|nr:permease [Alphaproteobacteria bacterium]